MLDLATLTASLPSAYFPLLCSWERVQAPPRLSEHSRTQLTPALRFCDHLQVRRSPWLCLFSISWGGLWSHQGLGARLPRQQSAKIAPGPSLFHSLQGQESMVPTTFAHLVYWDCLDSPGPASTTQGKSSDREPQPKPLCPENSSTELTDW